MKIYYAILSSNIIQNICGPESAGPAGWDDNSIQKRKRMAQNYISKKQNFYNKLENSILEKGIRNPILVRHGWIPESRKKYLKPNTILSETFVCDSLGGSRLYIAQKHDLNIPCIITSWCDNLNYQELKNEIEIKKQFKDQPEKVIINLQGVSIKNLPQKF